MKGSHTPRSSSMATTPSRGASTAARLNLPGIYHRKEYDAGETNPAPWRITCFFVDRDHRRKGVAREALDGALELIAQAGGGEVVTFANELVPGKKTSSSFLHNGTRGMFEKAGFTFERHLGLRKTVMRKTVPPAAGLTVCEVVAQRRLVLNLTDYAAQAGIDEDGHRRGPPERHGHHVLLHVGDELGIRRIALDL